MSFKDFTADTKKVVSSNLNQVIDIIQEDVSGSATRRKYQTFVTGGIGPGVTSSLYQTVYDQDFTLQTANPVLDMTVGLFHADNGTTTGKRDNLVTVGTGYSLSSTTGQLLFDSKSTMMMREKVNIYRQYANYLLGDPDAAFILDPDNYPAGYPNDETDPNFAVSTNATVIDAAMFINVKRLFSRDGVRKETFAIRLYKNAPKWDVAGTTSGVGFPYSSSNTSGYKYFYAKSGDLVKTGEDADANGSFVEYAPTLDFKSNLFERSISNHNVSSSESGVQILADLTAAQSFKTENAGGDVALLRLASDSTKIVGLIFYQAGIVVLNLGGSSVLAGSSHETGLLIDTGLGQTVAGTDSAEPVFEVRDPIHGIIGGMDNAAGTEGSDHPLGTKVAGQVYIGGQYAGHSGTPSANSSAGPAVTNRADQNSMNMGPATFYPDLLVSASIDDIIDHIGYTRFSSGSLTGMAFQNQTKINSSIYFCRAGANEFNTSNNPTFKDEENLPVMIVDKENDKPFTYITTVALADSNGDVVAIAKLNRPIEKNDESEVTIRVRLDF